MSIPESKLHLNFLVLKVVLLAQNYSGDLYKQRNGMRPGSLCPPLETLVLVLPQADLPEGLPHIGLFKHDSQQDLSSQAGHSDRMVRALGHFEQICL